jgi:ABC-type amino acid transport substrate-binding protein
LLELYVPANIFFSLSNNMVPAVVIFSIFLGLALISVDEKLLVLPFFDGLAAALTSINHKIVELTPYGIFFISAAAAGTLTMDELGRVQVYLVTYISVALLVTFWIFPGLISAVSGISFREILSTFRDSLVTAFATGSQFVVLPQIAENCKSLIRKHNEDDPDTSSLVDIIVPISFNFPSLGKLLVLLYVLFAAWFTDTQVDFVDRVQLAFNGVFSLFGSINVAVPYLLDSLKIPSDMFQLFLVTGIVVGRFGAMLAALHIIALGIIVSLALAGKLQLTLMSGLRYLSLTIASLFLLVFCLRAYFMVFVPESPDRNEVLSSITLMQERVNSTVSEKSLTPDIDRTRGSRLDRILDTRLLKVGFSPDNLPCTFATPTGQLVGFDIEMAHLLAEDLGVELVFTPITVNEAGTMLSTGQIDIAMSCIASLPDMYRKVSFSRSYLELTLALIARDHMRDEYYDIEALRQRDITIALVRSHYFRTRINQILPGAKIVVLNSAEEFFRDDSHGAEVLVLSAEEGAAYTYRYPRFTVIKPLKTTRIPASYAVPKGDVEMIEFVSNWVDLKRSEGTTAELYNYWMLGGVTEVKEARWSIIKDVLKWVD